LQEQQETAKNSDLRRVSEGIGKNQSKARVPAHQKRLISKFFYLFSRKYLAKTVPPKRAKFSHQTRKFALLRGTSFLSAIALAKADF
jgi:hypothetical protein